MIRTDRLAALAAALLASVPAVAQAPTGEHVLLSEGFDDNVRRWPLRPAAAAAGQASSEIVGGEFRGVTGAGQALNPLAGVAFDPAKPWEITLTAQSSTGAAGDGIGIAFGASKQRSQHLLMMNGARRSVALLRLVDGKLENRFKATDLAAISAAGPNILSVKASRGVWRFYVNGTKVGEAPAAAFFGDGVGIFQAGGENTRFDDLTVYAWDGDGQPPVRDGEARFRPGAASRSTMPAANVAAARAPLPPGASKPFAPAYDDAYIAALSDVTAFRSALSQTGPKRLQWPTEVPLTGQRGRDETVVGGRFVARSFDLGVYPTFAAARKALGPVLVAAYLGFGRGSAYREHAGGNVLERQFVVVAPDPHLSAIATISNEGRADGSFAVSLDVNLLAADVAVPPAEPPLRPDPALARALPLEAGLRKIVAAAPTGFAALRTPGALRIAGVAPDSQRVRPGPPPAYVIFYTGPLSREDSQANMAMLDPMIRRVLGPDTIMVQTQLTTPEVKYINTYRRGAGPTVVLTVTRAMQGMRFKYSQQITVLP